MVEIVVALGMVRTVEVLRIVGIVGATVLG
jgi:hypothetical protein